MKVLQGGKDFEVVLAAAGREVEELLQGLLPAVEGPEAPLLEAMRYATFAEGKRFRPFLAHESARLFGVRSASSLRVAAAVECIHTYALIHNDLAAIGDEPTRRGQPALHEAFDEATAILAGDALHSLAFEILAQDETHEDPRVRTDLIQRLAKASGGRGMVAARLIDLRNQGRELDIGSLTRLQRLRTGALIELACEAGVILGRGSREAHAALKAYAHDLGLAYQITTDLLGAEGSEDPADETPVLRADRYPPTFVSILGQERARKQAQLLADQAVAHLGDFDSRADRLRQAAHFAIERRR